MKQTVLPRTDLSLSRLSFGTASLHHLPTSSRRQALLRTALDHGFTHFDTAPLYGHGLAERAVGKFLSGCGDDITVASKVGLYPRGGEAASLASVWSRKALGKLFSGMSRPVVDWSVKRASQSLTNSLRRLRRSYVDILFLHEPDPKLLDADEFLTWMERQRDHGKVRYWGLAGEAVRFKNLIDEGHGLTQVLQVRDCLGGMDGHPVLASGRKFQLTYGYLSDALQRDDDIEHSRVLRGALSRNPCGSVIVSTRRIDHLRELVAAAES